MGLISTFAVHTGAAWAALAVSTVLSCWGIHDHSVHGAVLSLNYDQVEAVSLLRALAAVRAVTVGTLARHIAS